MLGAWCGSVQARRQQWVADDISFLPGQMQAYVHELDKQLFTLTAALHARERA